MTAALWYNSFMKKIFLTAFVFLLLQGIVCAQTGISFVYINGSNTNSEKSRSGFLKSVQKLHPIMKKQFEKNDRIAELFLKNGQYKINETPRIFFWGYNSEKDLLFVKQRLDISKVLGPTLAHQVRGILTAFLHDAIWIQKKHNMKKVLDELNEVIKDEYAKGNETVLYGYSAGSFITYEYFFNKLPYLNLEKLFDGLNASDNLKTYIKQNPKSDTCISALQTAGIGVVSEDGHLLFDRNEDNFKTNYDKLDIMTENYCMPQGAVKGIVNFASPLVLFYSDLADPDYDLTYYNKLMLKYIAENGLFLLTVNFREDPLGFPTSQNLTLSEISEITETDIVNPKGFVFDNSFVWGKRSCLVAHTSYWTTRKTFAKAVVKSYLYGYDFQYDEDFQRKVINSRKYKRINKNIKKDIKKED